VAVTPALRTASKSQAAHTAVTTGNTATTHSTTSSTTHTSNDPAAAGSQANVNAIAGATSASQPVTTNGPNNLVPYTSGVSLCVAIERFQTSIDRGQTARWVISAWTEGGNVPSATVHLAATPASLSGQFNFGCGSNDGTASCDLGEIDASSAQRELEAQVVVPATDASVTSVQLKVTGSAAHLPTQPRAAVAISVTAASASGSSVPNPGSTPLPVGNLPFLNGSTGANGSAGSSSTLSPGGNAGGLFPTLNPSSPQPGPSKSGQRASARTVANTSALPLGAPVVGAQLIGLAVLALAFVLAVTRLSIRRRPAAAAAAGGAAAGTARAADGNKPADSAMRMNGNKPADAGKPADDDKPADGDDQEG
jgi:hypothetical protein